VNLLALLLTLGGFTALCLGMGKYYKEHFQRPPSPTRLRLLRGGGWLSLALAFAASVAAGGWQIGPLLWFGWLSVSGLALVFGRPWLLARK
jgi:hypothetical protein